MGAHTNLISRKNTAIVVSFVATLILLVSTAYATNSSTIEVQVNGETVVPESESSEGSVEVESSSEETAAVNDGVADETEVSEESADITKDPITPTAPTAPSTPSAVSGQSQEAEDSSAAPRVQNDEVQEIIDEGDQDEYESDVRVRIRERSESELNGDDIENGDHEFKLEIRESTSI